MIEFIGHFHPLLVHLPIGILLIGLLLLWLSGKPKYAAVKPAVAIVLLAGCISALLSSITGYFLSISDDYDQSLINWHMWFAIGVLIVSAILYTKEVNPKVEINKKMLAIGLLVMIAVTGHLGGSLTHGSDYLSKPLKQLFGDDSTASKIIQPLANVQEAYAYTNVVQPILETRCYSCHNANKKKGGLRMDDSLLLMKGGKNGKVIDLTKPDESELIKRLLLPVDNEDHMPPKEKPQPTESQIALLTWWVSNHAVFAKKVKDLPQPDKIKPMLLALQKPLEVSNIAAVIPADKVDKADEKVLDQLRAKNVTILPVSQNSNYLTVSFTEGAIVSTQDINLLEKVKKQLIWLKIANSKMDESIALLLSRLTNVRRLNLSGTVISDQALQSLQALDKLEYLNLVGTNVSVNGLMPLKKIKTLQSVYLYQTKVAANDYPQLKTAFPKTMIDTGNYIVPLLATDTIIVL